MQRALSSEQVEAFYHDHFVEDQVRHFMALLGAETAAQGTVADIGGGCGFFARRLRQLTGRKIRVIDTDAPSVETCRAHGVDAVQGDALQPAIAGDEEVVCFNLILHHLVGASEEATRDLQRRALAAWQQHARSVFVNEYIYESYLGNVSGALIFGITKSRILSALGRAVAALVPSLKANTFGVGVRFRAHEEWRQLFAAAGYDVKDVKVGDDEPISLPRRLLLIKSCRRDSFLLQPRATP